MKKISTIVFLLISVFTIAQIQKTDKASVYWGEDLKFKRGEEITNFIGVYEGKYYMLKRDLRKGTDVVLRFSKDMQLEKEAIIDLRTKDRRRMLLESVSLLKGKVVILASYVDKKAKKNKLLVKTLNPKTLQGNKWEVVEEFAFEKNRRSGMFGLVLSQDESKLLVYSSKPYEKKGFEKFGFTVFDADMKQLWKKDIQLPYSDAFFEIHNYEVSNQGDAYIIGREYKESRKERERGKPNYTTHVLGYTSQGNEERDYDLNLGDKFITDVTIRAEDNGNLICAGLYSDKSSRSIKGTFFMKINAQTKKVESSSMKAFPEEFIMQGWSDRSVKKAKKAKEKKNKAIEMYEYDLRDLVLREDGGAVLLAEQYYVNVTTTTVSDGNGGTRTVTTYHYHYNDVIVVNISPKGEIDWLTKVEKNQYSVNDNGFYSSYALHVNEDKLHLVYNETARKYYTKEEFKQLSKEEKKAYFTILSTVNSDGKVEKEILLNAKKENTYPVPKLSKQINEKELFFYTKKRKMRKLAIVEFK